MWILKKCFFLLTVRASLTFVRFFFFFASCSIMISEVREQSAFQFFSHVLFFVSVELLNVGGDFVP